MTSINKSDNMAALALLGLDKVRMMVSLGSVTPSLTIPAIVIVPDVEIAELPLLIAPNPDVIEPELRAPTVVAAVVTKFGIAVISSSKYAAKSVTAA